MAKVANDEFDPKAFLAKVGAGKTILKFARNPDPESLRVTAPKKSERDRSADSFRLGGPGCYAAGCSLGGAYEQREAERRSPLTDGLEEHQAD